MKANEALSEIENIIDIIETDTPFLSNDFLVRIHVRLLKHFLKASGGNITTCASKLMIQRTTLVMRLNKFGLKSLRPNVRSLYLKNVKERGIRK